MSTAMSKKSTPPSSTILVGTYRKDQLKKWILPKGLYNYPIHAEDTAIKTAAPNVSELWLYAGKKDKLYFEARFDREVSVNDLDTLGYPRGKGKPHSDRYLLFKVTPVTDNESKMKGRRIFSRATETDRDTLSSEPRPRILVRQTDFKRSPMRLEEIRKIAAASTDKKPFTYFDFLPEDLLNDWGDSLFVCEEALQLMFWDLPNLTMLRPQVPFPPPAKPKFTFIDLFAGVGGFRLAMQEYGGKCVFSSEWDPAAQNTYYRNYGEHPFGDITKDSTKAAIPHDFDVLCAGFPCQPFSLAGVSARVSLNKKHGFADKTQGTLFFDIMQIVRRHHPKVLFLENVRNLVNHDGGRTFSIIKETIEREGYSFNYRVIDASPLVPQKRLRCYMVCVRNSGKFVFPEITGTPLPLRSILEQDVSDLFTISDNLWAGHQRRTSKNLARGTGFTAFTANLDEPSHTLVARYYKDGKECLIPQDGKNPRLLTPRECARLQGFPEEFILPSSRSIAYKQMGNSVAVPVLRRIAECIVNQILEGE